MIRISQLKLPVGHTEEELRRRISKTLRCGEDDFSYTRIRQSLDARHKNDKKFVYTVDVTAEKEKKILQNVHNNNIMLIHSAPYRFPSPGTSPLDQPPVIVGSGPAGLFCAWYLARAGYRPLIIERGEEADKRKQTVDAFWRGGTLDPDSNVQFGEGGAGTFSDGKLNTLVKDPNGRNREVLTRFVQAGAPKEILWQQKPHLGTDVLIGIVQTLRRQIIEMGGCFRFRTKLTGLKIRRGVLSAIEVNGGEEIPAKICVLALGHSARDTFSMLQQNGVYMEPKAFAVGLRIEHPQELINLALYGEEENPLLGPATYKVTHRASNGRGVYSFCMCPGGYVVNASSEPEMLAVNGMSYQGRDGRNANSALIVTVDPSDFPKEGPLGGIAFQRGLERKAWSLCKGKIPVQTFGDFLSGRPTVCPGAVAPQMKSGYQFGNVRCILPEEIAASVEEGVLAFGQKIRGFDRPDALLSGIESRTSSPVRIVRGKDGYSNIGGLIPCGEGAGYAGGITSAAMDGLKMAERICEKFRNFRE